MSSYLLILGGALVGGLLVYVFLSKQVTEARDLLDKLIQVLEKTEKR